jgi:hypothetical protein
MPKASSAGVFKVVDNFKKLTQSVEALTNTVVMVGVPGDKGGRKEGEISNVDLALIHDRGAPEAGIPARPFMEPGIKAVKGQIVTEFQNAGKAILSGGKFGSAKSVEGYLNRIGLICVRSIRAVITAGIAPELAPSTIRGRINRIKGKARRKKIAAELASGTPASRQNGEEGVFLPLVLSGQLRNSITYVLRKVGKGK